MKNIIQTIIIIIALSFSGILLYNNYQLHQEVNQTNNAHNAILAFYSDSLTQMKYKVTKYGDSLSQAAQIILSYENALSMNVIERDELKKKYLKEINTKISLQEEIKILKKKGEYEMVFTQEEKAPALPLKMSFKDKYFFLSVTADQPYPSLDSLSIFSYPVITSGLQKDPGLKNIFQKPYPVVIYENTNPYVSAKDIQQITIKDKQQWYQTDVAKIGGGVLTGFIIYSLIK